MSAAQPLPESAARITTAKIDPDGWKDGRRSSITGIGGSDIAKILGMHPTRTPFDCFMEKTGLREVDSEERERENARMRWGRLMEPVILTAYEEDMKIPIDHLGKVMFRSVERPWEQVSPDGLAILEPRGVEVKTAGRDQVKKWGAPGTDEAPEHYYLQAAWGMMVTGQQRWDIAVLIGGNDFRIYSIERDPDLEVIMRQRAEEFWLHNVKQGIPPKPIKGKTVAWYIRERFPMHLEPAREATAIEARRVREVVMAKREIIRLESKIEDQITALKLAIGDSAGLTGRNISVHWKKNRDTEKIDLEAIAKSFLKKLPASKRKKLERRFTRRIEGARPFRARLLNEETEMEGIAS